MENKLGRKKGYKVKEESKEKYRKTFFNTKNEVKKLSWDDVDNIRFLFRTGKKRKEIYELYNNVTKITVNNIISERTWKEQYKN